MSNLTETKKYLSRFGLLIILVIPIFLVSKSGLAFYKASLVAFAIGISELMWMVFFKPQFGKMESITDNAKLLPIMLFRGILYGAVILALCLGL